MEITDECPLCGVHVRMDKAKKFSVGHIYYNNGPCFICPSCWAVIVQQVRNEDARAAAKAGTPPEGAAADEVERDKVYEDGECQARTIAGGPTLVMPGDILSDCKLWVERVGPIQRCRTCKWWDGNEAKGNAGPCAKRKDFYTTARYRCKIGGWAPKAEPEQRCGTCRWWVKGVKPGYGWCHAPDGKPCPRHTKDTAPCNCGGWARERRKRCANA